MRSLISFAIALIVASAALVFADTAYAQATRTWVSGVGDDANPCSRTAPCKTFAGAISKTAAKGEISCLDPGGFGIVTITKSISIVCHYTAGSILASGGVSGITVNAAATDRVMLDGLDIEGAGTGLHGIRLLSASRVYVRNSNIRGFTGNGIHIQAPSGARLVLESSVVTYSNIGVNVQPTAGSNNVILERTVLDSNVASSLAVTGATSTVVLNQSTLIGPPVGLNISGGAQVISYENNVIRGSGVPTQVQPLQ